jgi:hypothetical protein
LNRRANFIVWSEFVILVMHQSVLSPLGVRIFYTFALVLLLNGCGQLDLAFGPLLYDVRVSPTVISPNADGDQDVTEIFTACAARLR